VSKVHLEIVYAESCEQGTTLDGNLMEIERNAPRFHVWPFKDRDLEFEDIIVVSDEVPPPPWEDGKSYTLWTSAHQENNLVVNGKRRMYLL
jgi:hypothetical protein